MVTINDRIANVTLMLGNRTDIQSRVIGWLGAAYLELGYAYPLETLEASETDTTTSGVGSGDIDFPPLARGVKDVTAVQTNGTTIPLDLKDIKWIRRLPVGVNFCGVPGVYATYGETIYIRPEPKVAVNLIIDYWQKPVLSDPVEDTPILLPDDWLEILDNAAALRGYPGLLEFDKMQAIRQYLFGYTDPETNHKTPGIIHSRMTRRQAQAPAYDYGLQPKTLRRPYTG